MQHYVANISIFSNVYYFQSYVFCLSKEKQFLLKRGNNLRYHSVRGRDQTKSSKKIIFLQSQGCSCKFGVCTLIGMNSVCPPDFLKFLLQISCSYSDENLC